MLTSSKPVLKLKGWPYLNVTLNKEGKNRQCSDVWTLAESLHEGYKNKLRFLPKNPGEVFKQIKTFVEGKLCLLL